MDDETRKELVNGLINYGMGKIEKDASKDDGANFTLSHMAIMNTIIMKSAMEYIIIQKVIPNTSDEDLTNILKEFYNIIFKGNVDQDKEKAEKMINGIILVNITQLRTFNKLLQHGAKSKEFIEFVSKSIQPLKRT